MKRKQVTKYIIAAVMMILFIGCILFVLCSLWMPKTFNTDSLRRQEISYRGQTYQRKKHIKTLLLLGIDQRDTLNKEKVLAGTGGQADLLWLFVFDEDANSVTILTIPRETIVNVEEHYTNGNFYRVVPEQICLQYAYGLDSTEGAALTAKAVERLLPQVTVDDVCAVSMGAIPKVIDAVGGVDIQMSHTYQVPNATYDGFVEYKEQTVVHMDGQEAGRFVHYRDIEHPATNPERMERQQDFWRAFEPAVKELASKHPAQLAGLVKELEPYYETSLTFFEKGRVFFDLLDENIDWEMQQLPGREVHVGQYDRYYIDEEQCQEMILPIFYEKVKE